LATLGGHWVALQSFAWARMITQYAREGSLAGAITKTFDGRHPCAICLVIQHGRQQEQGGQKNIPMVRLGEGPDLLCAPRPAPTPVPPTTAFFSVPFVPRWHADFLDTPPTPPPRAA
jgi:hypothetical protein